MARPRGTRSADFEVRRADLLQRLGARLAAPDGHRVGLRSLAEAIGVTYPTLRHYFGTRDGILSAFFEARFTEGQRYLGQMAQTDLPFAASVTEAVQFMVRAVAQPQFMAMHEIGLAEGLRTSGIGSEYLSRIFEPTLQAVERRLETQIETGELRRVEPRGAALALLSPILLGALHQQSLEGHALRPLGLDALGTQLADMFIAAYRASPELDESKTKAAPA